MRVAKLFGHRVEQGRCLMSCMGEIHQGHSRKGTKRLHSQRLTESFVQGTAESYREGREVL